MIVFSFGLMTLVWLMIIRPKNTLPNSSISMLIKQQANISSDSISPKSSNFMWKKSSLLRSSVWLVKTFKPLLLVELNMLKLVLSEANWCFLIKEIVMYEWMIHVKCDVGKSISFDRPLFQLVLLAYHKQLRVQVVLDVWNPSLEMDNTTYMNQALSNIVKLNYIWHSRFSDFLICDLSTTKGRKTKYLSNNRFDS